jgi:hypothetical protein
VTGARIQPVAGLDPLHTVPRPELRKAGGELVVELFDASERRVELAFRPVQAVRIWTLDLWIPPAAEGDAGRRVFEVAGSGWRRELARQLEELHPTASFLDHARHFVVPAGDDVVEVLAWQLLWRRDGDHGAHPAEAPPSSIPA